jgi:flagellar basal body rod protein FlgG
MRFVNRAATGVLSLVCVSALLVAGHWIARRGHHHPPAASHATGAATPASLLPVPPFPDCKMPDNPPASGPRTITRTAEVVTTGCASGACEHPLLSTELGTNRVLPAVSGHEPAALPHRPRTADASDSTQPSAIPQPMPLPLRTDALPILPDGPDFPIEPPASAPTTPRFGGVGPVAPGPNSPNVNSPNVNFPKPISPGRRIIDRALPNSSAEEREVWHEQLKDLSPHDVRELLRLREELGRTPPSTVETRPLLGPSPLGQSPLGQSPFGPSSLGAPPSTLPLWPQATPGPTASEPLLPPGDSPGLLPDGERDAARTIGASLEAIAQAQQVLLNNVANAGTDGYKRAVAALESAAASSSRGSIGMGVRLGPVAVDAAQGKIRKTDRPLDLAIDGEGFFQLEDRQTHQLYYTRCGRFAASVSGELVWRNAHRELFVLPAVKIAGPETDVEISVDGMVTAGPVSVHDRQQRIEIVRVPALADLAPTGENLFTIRRQFQAKGAGPDALSGRVRQGCLEESNVDVERELHEIERLRNQAHALGLAAQGLPLGARNSVNPPVEPSTLPSHFAGNLGLEPR